MEETTIKQKSKGRARNLILHLHPARLPEASLEFTLTFGLGGMSAVLFVLQVFTGILLRFVYSPVPGDAYDSVLAIQETLLFGQLVRNIHHWSGILFVLVTFLHLLRTFYTGAFYWPRRWNWVIGIALMITVILANFTGYLLPWDQLSYWAITVSTSMLSYFPLLGSQMVNFVRGGSEVGAPTLLIFYNFHTAILPLVLTALMAFHFWRVRKNKGVVIPRNSQPVTVPTDPHLIGRELVVALVLIAVILLASVFFDAPLRAKADPAYSSNPAKAPWYFMGIQELLMHFHPFIAAFLIPSAFLAAMLWLPFTRFKERHEGIWFFTRKGKKLAALAALISLAGTILAILASEYVFDFGSWFGGIPPVIGEGLIPFLLVMMIVGAITWIVYRMHKPDKSELLLFIFTFLMTAYFVLSVTGIWFRGPGMEMTFYIN